MALLVTEEIHKRLHGLFERASLRIQRATSSPSLPASVAIITSAISFRFNCALTVLNCLRVFGITVVLKCLGNIGRSSIFHVAYFLSYWSGVAKVTKWPSAHVTTYCFPSI